MTSLNRACLLGNLGSDPEIRTLDNGNRLATFSLATGESWKDKTTGEKRERTEWHRVVIFNEGLVAVAEQYLRKGAKIYIEGAIRTRSWEKDGEKRYATEIVLNGFDGKLVMAGGGGRPGPGGPDDYGQTSESAGAGGATQDARPQMDDEIPF